MRTVHTHQGPAAPSGLVNRQDTANATSAQERRDRAELNRNIATRLGAGQSGTSIARDLGVSEVTVYRHRAAINESRPLEDDEEIRVDPCWFRPVPPSTSAAEACF